MNKNNKIMVEKLTRLYPYFDPRHLNKGPLHGSPLSYGGSSCSRASAGTTWNFHGSIKVPYSKTMRDLERLGCLDLQWFCEGYVILKFINNQIWVLKRIFGIWNCPVDISSSQKNPHIDHRQSCFRNSPVPLKKWVSKLDRR